MNRRTFTKMLLCIPGIGAAAKVFAGKAKDRHWLECKNGSRIGGPVVGVDVAGGSSKSVVYYCDENGCFWSYSGDDVTRVGGASRRVSCESFQGHPIVGIGETM